MKKPISESLGAASPRAFAALLLCVASGFLTMLSFASTPSNGTITPDMPLVSYTAGPFFVINPTPVIEVDEGPECDNPVQPCDDFALTTNLPAGSAAAAPTAAVKATFTLRQTGD